MADRCSHAQVARGGPRHLPSRAASHPAPKRTTGHSLARSLCSVRSLLRLHVRPANLCTARPHAPCAEHPTSDPTLRSLLVLSAHSSSGAAFRNAFRNTTDPPRGLTPFPLHPRHARDRFLCRCATTEPLCSHPALRASESEAPDF
ncbi:hypothetical protein C2E23DRAFT_800940 [Lenzites betulinus]|nr:hypothetical protein C2E23DRAFT_800940 [Lenzites betulinus]